MSNIFVGHGEDDGARNVTEKQDLSQFGLIVEQKGTEVCLEKEENYGKGKTVRFRHHGR